VLSIEYIAGFLDGEGSFQCYHYPSHPKNTVHRQIVCTNTYLPVLQGIQERLGGRIYNDTSYNTLGKKPRYTWKVGNVADLTRILEELIPHLMEKRGQAEELLASCKLANRSCKSYERASLHRVS
jgi:hypothetical protein